MSIFLGIFVLFIFVLLQTLSFVMVVRWARKEFHKRHRVCRWCGGFIGKDDLCTYYVPGQPAHFHSNCFKKNSWAIYDLKYIGAPDPSDVYPNNFYYKKVHTGKNE